MLYLVYFQQFSERGAEQTESVWISTLCYTGREAITEVDSVLTMGKMCPYLENESERDYGLKLSTPLK